MAGKLQKEIKQTKPFASIEEETILNLVRTAEYISAAGAQLFKSVELTPTQYNALRILRGAADAGLMCGEISERMLTRESDITRLLDRLENAGYITRERPATNRRVVITKISAAGLELLDSLDAPMLASHKNLVGHLGEEKLRTLNDLLEEVRGVVEE